MSNKVNLRPTHYVLVFLRAASVRTETGQFDNTSMATAANHMRMRKNQNKTTLPYAKRELKCRSM